MIIFCAILNIIEFYEPILFFVHGLKGKFEGKQKGARSPKPERPCPSNLVHMHFTSTSTCIIFLSQFHFLTPIDYSPWSSHSKNIMQSHNRYLPFLCPLYPQLPLPLPLPPLPLQSLVPC